MKRISFIVSDDEAELIRCEAEEPGSEVWLSVDDDMGRSVLEFTVVIDKIEEV